MTVDPYGLVGQVLDGQFRVDAAVGEGGFSVVYKGRHLGLDEPIAIKCLKLQAQLGTAIVDTFVRRFRDESKIQYKLSKGSLHIVRTIAAGTTMAPATSALVPYMVLEWLDGFTLASQLRARRERGESGRPLAEVFRDLDPVADAMAFAHSLGVVHRDLNPSNIFLAAQPNGGFRCKVMDFGVAKVVSDHALALGPRAQTFGSIRMFTPAYGAPEQFTDSAGAIGTQTDVYAFALLVVELLSDRPPVSGEHLGDYLDRATDPLVRPTPRTMGVAIGDSVEAVLLRALDVDPKKRHGDIGELWGELKNAATRDEETSRRASSHPAAVPGQQVTKKGTFIIPEQLEDARDVALSASRQGHGSTRPIAQAAWEEAGPSTARMPSTSPPNRGGTSIVVQPASASSYGSPLSTTMTNPQPRNDAASQAAIASHFRDVLGGSVPPVTPAPPGGVNPAFAMHQFAAPMTDATTVSKRPLPPLPGPTPRSFPLVPVLLGVFVLVAAVLAFVAFKLLWLRA